AVNLPIALIAGEGEDVAAVEQASPPKAASGKPAPRTSSPAQEAPVEQVAEAKPPKPAAQPAAAPKRAPVPAEKEWTGPTVTLTVREALRDAMAEEMRRDDSVFLMGEEVAE